MSTIKRKLGLKNGTACQLLNVEENGTEKWVCKVEGMVLEVKRSREGALTLDTKYITIPPHVYEKVYREIQRYPRETPV